MPRRSTAKAASNSMPFRSATEPPCSRRRQQAFPPYPAATATRKIAIRTLVRTEKEPPEKAVFLRPDLDDIRIKKYQADAVALAQGADSGLSAEYHRAILQCTQAQTAAAERSK